jgi:hypothetical protein
MYYLELPERGKQVALAARLVYPEVTEIHGEILLFLMRLGLADALYTHLIMLTLVEEAVKQVEAVLVGINEAEMILTVEAEAEVEY